MSETNGVFVMGSNYPVALKRALCMALLAGTVFGVTACGNKEKSAGQALVRVNGDEITVLQFNDELKRAGVRPEQMEVASKQLLEALIDRQLVLAEAYRSEIDRTVEVVQAIERAKAQIISQAYLRGVSSKIAKPSVVDVEDYFKHHPEYFSQRKQFDVQQLVVATKDLNSDLRSVVDSAKSLDVIANWMDARDIRYGRGQLTRSATDLPEHLVAKLKEMRPGQIFIVNEGESSMINFIANIRVSPISSKAAAPQIEQYLFNEKVKEMTNTEVKHLRASAKIEYLNLPAPTAK